MSIRKQTKRTKRLIVTKRFPCPLCQVRCGSSAARMVHVSTYHFSDPAEMVEDFLDGAHPGVKEYREVIRRKAREAKDVLELERLYKLPSGKSCGISKPARRQRPGPASSARSRRSK